MYTSELQIALIGNPLALLMPRLLYKFDILVFNCDSVLPTVALIVARSTNNISMLYAGVDL